MARDTIDAAIQEHNLKAGSCKTMGLQLEGAQDWSPTLYIRLVQDYGLESEVSPGFPCWRGLAFPKIKHQHNLDWSGEPDQSLFSGWGRDSSNRNKF